MLHRIFLAVNFPEGIKKKLISYQENWPNLPIRWTKPENLHITLLFLGNLDDNQLNETMKKSKEIISKHKSFIVNLKNISYGPPKRNPPKMVWVEGEDCPELSSLQKDLEEGIFGLPSYQYKDRDKRELHPHVTLGRIKAWEFRKMEEKPDIDEFLDLSFQVNSVEIMESFLKKGGPEYIVLESIELE